MVLFDNNPERQAVIGEFAKVLFKEEYPNLDFEYTTSPEVAFTGADFVFCQIRTGGYPMREKMKNSSKFRSYWTRNLWFWRICLWNEINRRYD